MGAFDFTYKLPNNFDKRVVQYLQQFGMSSVSEAFQRCVYEYDDVGLEMIEEFEEKDFENGNSSQHYWNYKLSKDKEMLKYLYNLKDQVDYVIFENHIKTRFG